MRITELYLYGFKRLALSFTKEFHYKPTSPTQFIIGTNGSGKSSLKDILNPLPANKADFSADGKKEIDIIRGGDVFKLITDFAGEHPHCFIMNGVELNDGHKITDQYRLVAKHLHYTPEIHAVVTGKILFTDMRPPERKYWFTNLADANFDYPIGVFNRLTTSANDLKSSIKLDKKRLVTESAKIMSKEEYATLCAQRAELYTSIQELIELRQPQMEPVGSIMNKSHAYRSRAMQEAEDVKKLIKTLDKSLPTDPDTIQAMIESTSSTIAEMQGKSNALYQEYEKSVEFSSMWKNSKLQNVAQLGQQYEAAKAGIAQCEEKLKSGIFMQFEREVEPVVAFQSIDYVLGELPSLLSELHDNRERQYTRESYNHYAKQRDETVELINQANTKIARFEEQGNYIHSHEHENPLDCPKCNHRFQPIFDPVKLEKLSVMIGEVERARTALKTKLAEINEVLTRMDHYFEHYKRVLQMIHTSQGLRAFGQYLNKSETLLNEPGKVPDLLLVLRARVSIWAELDAFTKQAEESLAILSKMDGEQNLTAEAIEENRLRLEKQVEQVESQKRTLNQHLSALRSQQGRINALRKLEENLLQSYHDLDDLQAQALESARRQHFAEFLTHMQLRAADLEQTIHAADRQQSVIDSLEGQIKQSEAHREELLVLIRALSPTEGLIAEGIFAYMRVFVEEMNKLITMVWSYPLVVKPCSSMENDEESALTLDYRFPLSVDGELRSDVSEGSSGMLEIINFSFRAAAMKALGLGDYPLFLDEFGATMDQTHKEATIGLISAIVDLDNFEQLFMISHDVVQYGSLGTAQICVLHEGNIKLPPNCVYNKHVTMV